MEVSHFMDQKAAITRDIVLWQTCSSSQRSNITLTRCMTNIEIQPQPNCLLKITSSELLKNLNLESYDFSSQDSVQMSRSYAFL